jgi:hypothetical protein
VQQPENLIARIILIRDETLRGQREIHGDGAAEWTGPHRSGRNILVRLPQNFLIGGPVVARSGDDSAHARQAQVDAVQARIQTAAPGMPGAPGQPAVPPPGPRELESARIQMNDKYSTYLDTGFELQKARLQLLRAAGKLDDWALGKH